MEDNVYTRRRLMATGAASLTAVLTGCSGESNSGLEETAEKRLESSQDEATETECSPQEYFLESGEPFTVTVENKDYQHQLLDVRDEGSSATMKVGGNLRQFAEGDTYNVEGQEFEIEDAIERSEDPDIVKITYRDC